MAKSILVIAILALSTSGAFAAHRTHHPHHAMNAYATTAAPPVGWMGGVNSGDHAMYLRNLHDSGYNPRGDYNANGLLVNQ